MEYTKGKVFIYSVIPVENRIRFIIEQAERLNNYQDCDVIHENINTLIKTIYLQDAEENIDNLINACIYRVGKNIRVKAMLRNKEEIKSIIKTL